MRILKLSAQSNTSSTATIPANLNLLDSPHQIMKNSLYFFIFFTFFLVACQKSTEVSGEIFIATKGGENIKLGGVQIAAIPERIMQKHFEDNLPAFEKERIKGGGNLAVCDEIFSKELKETKNSVEIEIVKQNLDRCQRLNEQMINVAFNTYFQVLPPAAYKTNTDSEGKFKLKLDKPDKYVLVAKAERAVVKDTEYYYWFLKIDAKGESQQISFTHQNLAGMNSADSALQVAPLIKR